MSAQLDRPIHCIYASTSGNVEAVVEKVAAVLGEHGLTVQLHRAEQTDISIIRGHERFIFATSTWERGQISPFFKPLLKQLKETDCHGKSAGMIGLGDNRYETVFFNVGIESIRTVWKERGGAELFRPLKLNGDPYEHLDTLVTKWANDIAPYFDWSDKLEGYLEGEADA